MLRRLFARRVKLIASPFTDAQHRDLKDFFRQVRVMLGRSRDVGLSPKQMRERFMALDSRTTFKVWEA